MKIVLAGAFGNLGAEILKALCDEGCEVVAADLKERPVAGTEGKYTFRSIDATRPETLNGLCDEAEVVITTIGLTSASTRFTAYDFTFCAMDRSLKVKKKEIAAAYFSALRENIRLANTVDPAAKKTKTSAYVDGLFANGGPAVNQFGKLFGEETAREIFNNYLFSCR